MRDCCERLHAAAEHRNHAHAVCNCGERWTRDKNGIWLTVAEPAPQEQREPSDTGCSARGQSIYEYRVVGPEQFFTAQNAMAMQQANAAQSYAGIDRGLQCLRGFQQYGLQQTRGDAAWEELKGINERLRKELEAARALGVGVSEAEKPIVENSIIQGLRLQLDRLKAFSEDQARQISRLETALGNVDRKYTAAAYMLGDQRREISDLTRDLEKARRGR